MGAIASKRYTGYKSHQYLEAGKDYRAIKLAREIDPVAPYEVPLTQAQEKRVQGIFRDNIVIALHDHLWCLPEDLGDFDQWAAQGRTGTAYEALAQSCLDAAFDNLMDGMALMTSASGWQFKDVVYDLGLRLSDLAHQDFVIRCERVSDIYRAHGDGRLALIPSMECATAIEQEIDRIDVFHGLGFRMMGIAYSQSNMLGSGLKEARDGGLTAFGRQAVERMNKIGMAIDVAHSGMQTALDAIRLSKKPVFISHAGAKAVWNSKRMFSDEIIKACAERGGVIGIESSPHTTASKKHPVMDIEAVMDHFEHCVELVGIDHVSFGLDSMYGDHVGLHVAHGGGMSIDEITVDSETGEAPKRVAYVKGLENPTEGYCNVIRWMVRHGYSDAEIAKVAGKNVLRVVEEVWC